jgi:hypothetical protein
MQRVVVDWTGTTMYSVASSVGSDRVVAVGGSDRTISVFDPRRCEMNWNDTTWTHRGWFEGSGVSTSRVSPPGPLSISYGHVGCLKARAFPPRV